MGLFKILKSVIGLGSSGSRSTSGTAEPGRENVDVTVEHEPDTTSEDAVKGTGDEATADADAKSTPAADPETAGDPDDASEDATEPEVEADAADAEVADTAETEPEAETEDAEVEETSEAESATEADAGADTEATDTDDADADEPDIEVENADAATDTIKGIGGSYAETLADAGVETVGDLAAADAAEIAGKTDISEKRLGRWIARARGEDE